MTEQVFVRKERRYLLPPSEVPSREKERRYLVPESAELVALLDSKTESRDYTIRTEYLVGRKETAVRHRLRFYDGGEVGWHERKRRVGLLVTKRRMLADRIPEGFHRVAGVTYFRRAWEIGKTRVTLDTGVSSGTDRLPLQVLEVKGNVPGWLKPHLPLRASFSKRRWATGELTSADALGAIRAVERL